MDYQKYADLVTAKFDTLVPALVGASMAFILMGKVFDSFGYSYSTILPSTILILCLWIPYFQRRKYIKN